MCPKELQNKLKKAAIIAVLVIDDVEKAVPTAKALVSGGITAMELTLRTEAALEALKRIIAEVPEMMAGVGTVINAEQVKQIKEVGAAFGVSPGFNPSVVDAAEKEGIPFAPGVMTPSEIEVAYEKGCNVLKFFPATPIGGIELLKSINGPYSYLGLQYIPLGGVNENNLIYYLESPIVLAVGGSWIAKRSLITDKKWDVISKNAERAIQIKNIARGE